MRVLACLDEGGCAETMPLVAKAVNFGAEAAEKWAGGLLAAVAAAEAGSGEKEAEARPVEAAASTVTLEAATVDAATAEAM